MATNSQDALIGLDVEQLKAVHRGALRGYWLYAALLVIAGVVLLALAILGVVPTLMGILPGAMAIAVSVIPIRQATERQERMLGLDVLGDDWREIQSGNESGTQEQFLALMRRLYG